MSNFQNIDWPVGLYAATLAIINGLIDHGTADRGKMIVFVESLLADLSPEARRSPYGVALDQALRSFEGLQPFPKNGGWKP